MINRRPTGNIQRDISDLFQEVSALANAVNQNQKMGSARNEGKEGDIRFVRREDGKSYLMCKGRNDWETTFQGCFQLAGNNTPLLHLESLSVDNLYAKMFTINQTNAYNGNWLMSSGTAIVESSTATTITFKDQTNLNLCPFAVNDKCEIRQISADKSLTIKLSQFTISSVSGRTATVVYESGHPVAKAGDIVVQRGNSSTATRQNALYFSINDADSPYIAAYSSLTGFTFPLPSAVFGNLDSFVSPVHGTLSGVGVYLKNNFYTDDGFIALNAEGHVRAGLTEYADNTNSGFYLGWDASAIKFKIRNSTTKYLDYNATDLSLVGGAITSGNIKSSLTMTYDRGIAGTEGGYWLGDYGTSDYRLFLGDASSMLYYNYSAGFTIAGGSVNAGAVRSSATMTYDRGIAGTEYGYWLGKYGTADYRFYIGNVSTSLKYNNSSLTLTGGNFTSGIITSGSVKSTSTMTYDRGVAGTEAGYWFGDYGSSDYRFFFGKSSSMLYYDGTNGLTVAGGTLNSGAVRSSSTMTYDRGVAGTEYGYWLGKYGTADYRFFIGNVSSNMKYDNSNFTITGGAITGATITGGTIQTATSNARVVINDNSYPNKIAFYYNGGNSGYIGSNTTSATLELNATALSLIGGLGTTILNTGSGEVRLQNDGLGGVVVYPGSGDFTVGGKFNANENGQLTRINNLAASSYTGYSLISDGTSFTPSSYAYAGSLYNRVDNTETSNTSAIAGYYAKANQSGSQAGTAIQTFASQYSDATLAGYGRIVTDASLNGLIVGAGNGKKISFRINNVEYAKLDSYGFHADSYYTGATAGFLSSDWGAKSATIGNTSTGVALYKRTLTINGTTVNVVTTD